ncbi:hypothetical protein ASZ90_004550 [hydrocarbon metagenome]|uniref:Yip1 domain-containing protein n=1 Tax=hydrocarbon metagenome TaxID=938273 RepID=A0A0W8FZF8_9ZZZZ
MKNVQLCPNCNAENPIYKYSCTQCKAFLRTRIVNIDLWHTISSLLESPVIAFRKIIEAEHKNYIIFLNSIIGIKLFLLTIILNSFREMNSVRTDYFFTNLFIVIGVSYILLVIAAYCVTKLNQLFGLENRFRDNYSILVYSFLPLMMSLVILSPVHYALFGAYWFTYNPPPYIVKPIPAYVLLFIEGLLLVWSLLLLILGNYTQTKNKIYSFFTGLWIYILIGFILYYLPLLPLEP